MVEYTPAENDPSRRWALAGLSLALILSSLGTSIANVGLPAMAEAFSASLPQVQWVVLAYLLAITTAIVSVGRLGDMIGRRRLLLAGIALFTLASALCGAAPTLWFLIAARAVQGLGAAIMMTLSLAMVADTVPKARIGRAMGLLGSMSAIGTAVGPTLGGVLVAAAGWHAMFLVSLPLGLLTLLLAYRHLPADQRSDGLGRFDMLGTLLLGSLLAAYALAMTTGPDGFGPDNIALLAAAAFGLGLFVLAQRGAASPLIQLEAFRKPGLSAGLVMSGLVMTVMMATLVVGPFYLTQGLGLDPALAGLAMSAGPLVTAVTGWPAGRLVDGFDARTVTAAGLLGMAAGCGLLSLATVALGLWGYIAPLTVLTVGYSLFQTANNSAVMADVAADQRALVSALLNLSRNLGLVTGASAMGSVFVLGSGTSDVMAAGSNAIASGTRITFAVGALLIVVALALALAGRVRSQRLQPAAGG